MHIPDLSPFEDNPRHLYVGWLDISHPYVQGKVSDAFEEKLWDLCLHPAVVIRGFVKCPFCQNAGKEQPLLRNGKKMPHGSGRIHIHGRGKKYIAHTLIFHYVSDHNYRPPDEFIEAVMRPRNWFQRKVDWFIFNCQ